VKKLLLVAFALLPLLSSGQKIPVMDWAFGATNATDWMSVHKMTTDASGNIIVVVYFSGTIDIDPGPAVVNHTATSGTEYDVCVAKFTSTGTLIWSKSFGGSSTDDAFDVDVDASGNIYVAGYFSNTVDFDPGAGTNNITSVGQQDGYLLKLNSDGDFGWVKIFAGTNAEALRAVRIIPTGGFVITGMFFGTTDFDPGPGTQNLTSITSSGYDVFIERLDIDGNFVWVSRIGGTASETPTALEIDAALNIYMIGEFRATVDFDPGAGTFNLSAPHPGFSEPFALKLDIDGNFVWAKKVTDQAVAPGVQFRPHDIQLDLSNNVLITGQFLGTADFDPSAATFSMTSASGDSYVSKLDVNGNFLWAKSFRGSGSIGENSPFSVDTDADGNVFISGAFKEMVDFDPPTLAVNSVLTAPAGSVQPYVVKLAPGGSFIWVRTVGGSGGSPVGHETHLNITGSGRILLSGKFRTTKDFDPTPCVYDVTAGGTSQHSFYLTQWNEETLHTITSFTPTSGPIGTPVTITGTNFSTSPAQNIVEFQFDRAATVSASTATTINTEVPALAVNGKISVTRYCIEVQSATNFTVTTGTVPTITSFTPTSGNVGTTVTITGTNFSATPANNTVRFNGTTATVTASTITSITTTVPAGATTGKITVTVAGNTATSATDFTVTTPSLPTITSFTPASGPIGTTVTITGTNFSTTPANNTVRFNGTTATATASTATSITTSVPTGATTGKITVTVAGNTATSATDFTITVATGIVINPQPQSISTCEGSIETFAIDASGAANITYQWQKFNGASFVNISNGGGYSGVTTKNLTINTTGNFGAGEYRCRVSGNATPDVMSQTATLEINPYPLAEISINGSLLVASPGDNYQWYQNGNEVSQANEQTFAMNVAEFGSYVVEVTANGCTSTSEEFIYLMTGAESIHGELKIYPNPFKENISIELPSEEKFNLTMVDALGRVIRKYSITNNETLPLGDLNDGMYILILQRGVKKYYYRMQKTE
jgi:hypothetical protein